MEPRDLSITEAAAAMADGELTPTDVIRSVYQQIDRCETQVNAFITLKDHDKALQEAREADRRWQTGEQRGVLDGMPIGLKDNFQTADMPTTAGSEILRTWRPEHDAPTVSALRAAGAVVVGKLNLHEFADGTTTDNPHFGRTNNPWDLGRTPAGSSGGSGAALTARMVMGATGSDTGGSIREPAAFCGVVGLKPTYGSLTTNGVVPFSWSLDHVGPMGRSVRDVAVLFEAMGGRPNSSPAMGKSTRSTVTIGVDESYLTRLMTPGVRKAFERTLSALEADHQVRVKPLQLPVLEHAISAELAILFSEAYVVHEEWLEQYPEAYGTDVRRSLLAGRLYSGPDYVRAQTLRTRIKAVVEEALSEVDYLASPTMILEAPPWGVETFEIEGSGLTMLEAFIRTLVPFNLSGHPALSVPCGHGALGLPVGLQLVGKYHAESELLAFGERVEQVCGLDSKSYSPLTA